jgi:hypothetical protein
MPRLAGGAAGFGDRCGDVLHRELGGGQQPARVLARQLGQCVVVRPGEGDGVVRGQRVEVGDRVGGEDLQVDARRVHRRQPHVDVHERAARVLHTVQVVVADPVERRAVGRCAQLRSGRPGRALGEGEHGVGVHVDHAVPRSDTGHALQLLLGEGERPRERARGEEADLVGRARPVLGDGRGQVDPVALP